MSYKHLIVLQVVWENLHRSGRTLQSLGPHLTILGLKIIRFTEECYEWWSQFEYEGGTMKLFGMMSETAKAHLTNSVISGNA